MAEDGWISTWRIEKLCNPLFTATLAEQEACGRCMSQDVATDRLASVGAGEHGTGARIGLDLIGHEDGDVELVSKLSQLA
jgi:hypothetical protein